MRKGKTEPMNDPELHKMIEQVLQGMASEQQCKELNDRLLASAEDRRYYLHYLNLHATLSRQFAFDPQGALPEPLEEGASEPRVEPLKPSSPQPSLSRLRLVAAAAGIALLVGALLLWPREKPEIARITALSGSIQWTGDGGQIKQDLEVGNPLHGGTLESLSTDSWATIELRDGSTVTISGHSVLTISDQKQKTMHLRQGSLSASVITQPATSPMLVYTPTAELQVLGTQFNVDAELTSTVLNVNEGRVRVKRIADGSIAEVPANHQVVAAASRHADFKVIKQPVSVSSWKSALPQGIVYGEWLAELKGLRATPLLWRSCKNKDQKPILLYLAALSVSRAEQPPVALQSGAKLRIQGRIEKPMDVLIGLTTQHLKGGFAGKHHALRKAAWFPKEGGAFLLEVAIEEFTPAEPEHPKSPIGLGLFDWWSVTFLEDVGLTITGVELIPPVDEQQGKSGEETDDSSK